MINELIEDIPRATMKKIQLQKESISKQLRDADSSITEVNITTRQDDLKYWDEADKIRTVKKVEMGVAGPVISQAMESDLGIILGKSQDQKDKSSAQSGSSPDYDRNQHDLWMAWDQAATNPQAFQEDPEEEDVRFSQIVDSLDLDDGTVKEKPFWRFR